MATPYSLFNTRSGTDPAAGDKVGLAVSGAATHYSEVWTGENQDGYALTVFYTGTPTGTFTLWMTDKPNPSLADDSDWVQDTTFVASNPAGAAGKFRDDAANAKAARKRLKYVHAAGSGTVSAFVTIPN